MRSLLKLFVAFAVLFISAPLVSCQDRIITVKELPSAAQSFISEYSRIHQSYLPKKTVS